MEPKRIKLGVPADRNMLLIIRMTTAGVVSRAGFTLDEADDVKMAVDEACNLLLLQKPGAEKINVLYEYNNECVKICVCGEVVGEGCEAAANSSMQEVIRCILESMVDEAELKFRPDGGTQAVCLTKKLSVRQGAAS